MDWTEAEVNAFKNTRKAERFRELKREADRRAWFARWPKACRECDGYGLVNRPGNLVCECTEEYCPRCGTPDALNEAGEGPCPHCDWDWNDGAP